MTLFLQSSLVRSPALRQPTLRIQQQGLKKITLGHPYAGNKSRWPIILSGLAGGAVAVVVGGYAFYHWSGLKHAVDIVRHPILFLKQQASQKSLSKSGVDIEADTAAELLAALRQAAKAYVAAIPGAGALVDVAFNEIEKVVYAHKDEARDILKAAFEEMQEAAKARGADYKGAAWDTLTILRTKLGQVQALAAAAGQDKIGPLFDRFPGFYEHASGRILGVRASLLSLRQKGLEKGKSVVSGLSGRSNDALGPVSSAAEATTPDANRQKKQTTGDVSGEQSSESFSQ